MIFVVADTRFLDYWTAWLPQPQDKMFILRNGQAVACIAGEKGEIEVKQYSTPALHSAYESISQGLYNIYNITI